MMAKAKALEAQKQMERIKMEQFRQTSMSPHEKLIQVGDEIFLWRLHTVNVKLNCTWMGVLSLKQSTSVY